jgi:hypothetical protein
VRHLSHRSLVSLSIFKLVFGTLSIGTGLCMSSTVAAQDTTAPAVETVSGIDKANRTIIGRVLSARDKKPLKEVPLLLGKLTAQSDEHGEFRFTNPPTGDQLIAVDPRWLASKRQKLPDGSLSGSWHADPAAVDIADAGVTRAGAPIFVIEPAHTVHCLVSGKGMTFQPVHIPEMIVTIPEGTTILGPDGRLRPS